MSDTRVRIALFLTGLTLIILGLYANGNILVFTQAPPIQVCVGWPDDEVFSYWCTPDYTARPPDYEAELVTCGENLYHTMAALNEALIRLETPGG